jgi:hypothetical protein
MSAWTEFCDAARELEKDIVALAPDEQTRGEGLAYLARMTAWMIERELIGGKRVFGNIDFGAPEIAASNPHYRMGRFALKPGVRYRIAGRVNGADRIGFGSYTLSPGAGMVIDHYTSLDNVDVDADGRFTLEIGGAAEGRNRLPVKPTSSLVMIRELYLTPGQERAVQVLSAPDGPSLAEKPDAPSPEDIAKKLASVQRTLAGTLKRFYDWTETFAKYPNTMTNLEDRLDKATQGDLDTHYYSGYFNLQPNQALRIEVPNYECEYWMIGAYTFWLEPIPGSHFNHKTAKTNADGTRTVIVAHRDPGVANWLPTGGRQHGSLFGRTVKQDRREVPRVKLITL